jgi:hypothetical protein
MAALPKTLKTKGPNGRRAKKESRCSSKSTSNPKDAYELEGIPSQAPSEKYLCALWYHGVMFH